MPDDYGLRAACSAGVLNCTPRALNALKNRWRGGRRGRAGVAFPVAPEPYTRFS